MNASNQHINQEQAAAMIGKSVIIGLTIHDRDDNEVDRVQLHGETLRINQEEGVVVKLLPSGVEYNMPAVLGAFEEAPPGDYQFQNSGEIITNPDLMTSWVVYEPETWKDEG